jgi:hypothetical protein
MGVGQRHPSDVSTLESADAGEASLQAMLGALRRTILDGLRALHDPAIPQEPVPVHDLI